MKKKLLIGLILVMLLVPWLLVGCGVSEQKYQAVVAERDSTKAELQSTRSELDAVKSELESVQKELAITRAELELVKAQPLPAPVPLPAPAPPPLPAPAPAPSPMPAPAPAPAPVPTPPTPTTGYARSSPAAIGTELSIEDEWFGDTYEFNITPLEIVRGSKAWSRIKEANMFNEPPPSGFEYILVRIRFEYLEGPTPDTSYDVSDFEFTTVSSEGKDYKRESIVAPEPTLDADLYPGASHEGWGVFLVAVQDDKPLLTFGRDYKGRGGIWWQLY